MSACFLCPRSCGADRSGGKHGFCGVGDSLYVAKIMLHAWEEPCFCHGAGAGTIFFSGCNLRCIYCQNNKISRGEIGRAFTPEELEAEILSLQNRGASCIEFVTPTHYTDTLVKILQSVKPRLHIPVVWNSGGYEKVETLRMLDGLVDIYLPDLKYFSPEISKKYSHAENYFPVARDAILEMLSQVGAPRLCDGKMLSGVIVRHLVLPACREDSVALLEGLAEALPDTRQILLSLMSQYTPDFYIEAHPECECKNLCRRVTSFEYDSALRVAEHLGFEGYFQNRSSASKSYTPEF